MASLEAITLNTHKNKHWLRAGNYFFTKNDIVGELNVAEFQLAMMAMAIGFVHVNCEYLPASIQGVEAGQNLFLAADGRWLGSYIPAIYRVYPFQLAKTTSGELALCIDKDSGLITEENRGELFFDDNNQPSEILTKIIEHLKQIEKNKADTKRICSALQKYDLFEPWPVQVLVNNARKQMNGVYRISEEKLNALSPEALVELRDKSALFAAYAQLFSMQNTQLLAKFANEGPVQNSRGNIQLPLEEFGMLGEDGVICFDNLR